MERLSVESVGGEHVCIQRESEGKSLGEVSDIPDAAGKSLAVMEDKEASRVEMKGWRKTANGREPTDPRMQQIVFQIQAGRPFREIADQFKITIGRVSQIRRSAGLQRRVNPAVESN